MLWLDCCAGAVVGFFGLSLTFGSILGPLTGLPGWVLVLMGSANLLYASFSLSIASAAGLRARAVRFLVLANALWSLVCLSLACAYLGAATTLGMIYLVAEAAFVAFLAFLESKALGVRTAAT